MIEIGIPWDLMELSSTLFVEDPPPSLSVWVTVAGVPPPPSPGHGMAALLQRGINVSFGDRYGKKNATILRHRSLIGDWLEQFAVNR